VKNKLVSFVIALAIIISLLLGTNVSSATAGPLNSDQAALPNPGTIVPVPSKVYAKYSAGPHLSGFAMGYITNRNKVLSSIDLGYSGQVVAPITGRLAIAKSCGDHQIVFIQGTRASNGYGWAIGMTHIWVNPKLDKQTVTQGQVIGKTVLPPAKPGKGCGYGSGMHIHYTLMKWNMGANGPLFTEQSITNTYIGPWIVKNTYLDGATHDIKLGQLIK
jgi:hypothetical protein